MKKKITSRARFIISFMLAMTLMLCMAAPAFASNVPSGPGTPGAPAQAAITKVLNMAEGVTTPAATFTFTISPISVDGVAYTPTPANMPTISNATILFAATDVGTTAAGVKSVPLESANIVAGVTWPHAGVFKYGIVENASVAPYVPGSAETFTYSQASYEIDVYVSNSSSGLFVEYIAAIRIDDDSGTAEPTPPKTDPTPGGDGSSYFLSQMMFTNSYAKTTGTNPITDPSLEISKVVAGLGANQNKPFSFAITLTMPAAGVTGTPTYNAYVIDSAGIISPIGTGITATTNVGNDGTNDYIEFPTGTAVTVNLMHDQKLAFVGLHVGTTFLAIEAADVEYIAEVDITLNGGSPINLANSAVNTARSTLDRLVTEGVDSADFTNTRDLAAPTGISMNNLPFVVLIIIVIAALALYVVIRSRKRAREATE